MKVLQELVLKKDKQRATSPEPDLTGQQLIESDTEVHDDLASEKGKQRKKLER
jgi:hypothetical protein